MALSFLATALYDESHPMGRTINVALVALIVTNCVAAVVETIPGLPPQLVNVLNTFELISIIVFSIEYLARFLCCTTLPAYGRPVLGRIRYLLTPMAIIDLIVLLPFFFGGMDIRTLRVLRLLRLLRLMRYEPYARSLRGFGVVLRERRGELMLCALLAFGILLVTATFMYHLEREAQPNVMGSIPACLWWAVIHLTTIGYGDVYPVTTSGKILAGVTAFIGVGFVTLPSSIFAMAYVQHLREEKTAQHSPFDTEIEKDTSV